MLEIFGAGILMGIAFAAPPGAVTAETFRRGLRGGFAHAFRVQLGSLIGDAFYALLALAGLAALVANPILKIALGAFGAIFLIYLAWNSIRSARPDLAGFANLPGLERGAFLSGMAISLANPWAIAFWLSLGGALSSLGLVRASAEQIAFFFASFLLGAAVWALVLSLAIARVRGWMRPAIFSAVSIVCGVALGAFGIGAASQVLFSIFDKAF